ncbi:MAG: homoserine dehydrogenase [Lachnospiraceae bacterium]|nr:homoserine dehydrogenase [Lachnospiraceae bacterium]
MKIALLGHGTIGLGVDHILKRTGGPEVTKILSLIVDDEMAGRTASSIDDIVSDPEIGLVAEVMGGVHPAYEFISKALSAGKHVVTANKAVAAAYFAELTALAEANGVSFRYTSAAGGSIPWLMNLARAKRVNPVLALSGIVNGTCNYILTRMEEDGVPFGEALSDAQRLGFAERDPAADIDGADTLRKLVLSLNVAYDTALREETLPCAGIRNITPEDLAFGRALGLKVRMLMKGGRNEDGSVYGFAEPVFLPADSPEGCVRENMNLVSYVGTESGLQRFSGYGAGRYPTAYNLVEDILDAVSGTAVPYTGHIAPVAVRNDLLMRRYYVRTSALPEVPAHLIESTDGTAAVTRPVSPADMHRLAKLLLEKDPLLFFAGMEEGEEKC